MAEKKQKPPIEPRKYFFRGLTLPGLFVLTFGGIGILISLYNKPANLEQVRNAASIGAAVGLFFLFTGLVK